MYKKFILGTAQFGMHYGITNKKGKTKKNEIAKILNYLSKKNISFIDTASTYGKSELEIGNYLKKNNKKFKIITKYSLDHEDIIKQFTKTKKLIGQNPDIILAHSSKDYLSNKFQKKIDFLKKNLLIKNVGVSLYNTSDFFKIIKFKIPDIIQVPLNIFDKRFLDKKIIKYLKKYNIKMHARSIFLQGLLFLNKEKIYKNFNDINDSYEKMLKIAHKEKLNLSHLSLVWAYKKKEINKIVLGVNSLSQLKLNLSFVKKKISTKSIKLIDEINLHDNKIIKPNLWKTKKLQF
tara:strand:- start:3282 stop:4154 length:873 start_codon:yes stop_codon:yes gene_type:complete